MHEAEPQVNEGRVQKITGEAAQRQQEFRESGAEGVRLKVEHLRDAAF